MTLFTCVDKTWRKEVERVKEGIGSNVMGKGRGDGEGRGGGMSGAKALPLSIS